MELEECLKIEKQSIKENEVMVVRFPLGEFPIKEISNVAVSIQRYMSPNKVVFIPTQYDEEIIDKESLKKILQQALENLE